MQPGSHVSLRVSAGSANATLTALLLRNATSALRSGQGAFSTTAGQPFGVDAAVAGKLLLLH